MNGVDAGLAAVGWGLPSVYGVAFEGSVLGVEFCRGYSVYKVVVEDLIIG